MSAPRPPTELAAHLDARLTHPVVVFGSLPAEADDLDLIALPAGHQQVHNLLVADGFRRDGSTYARFVGCGVEVVDLVHAGRFGIPQQEAERLFTEARRLADHDHLLRPSPHDTLLILARQVAGETSLAPKRRARAEWAASDPGAWGRAMHHASQWGATRALAMLERHLDGRHVGRRARVDTVAELLAARHDKRGFSRLRAWRQVLRRPPGHLIAISGLDGAGKSTQVEALADSLQTLGHESVKVWTRLGSEPWLDRVALPVKGLLARLTGTRWDTRVPAATVEARLDTGGSDLEDLSEPGGLGRRLVRDGWALFIALANVTAHRRSTRPHLRAGRVVVCDRYVLDSIVHLRYRYAPSRPLRLHVALLRLLSPKPVHAALLDISGEAAWQRKQDHYVEAQLRLQAALYEEERHRSVTERLDGTLPRDEICAHLAEASWQALRRSGRQRSILVRVLRRVGDRVWERVHGSS